MQPEPPAELVEIAAKALCRAVMHHDELQGEWQSFEREARAVLAAVTPQIEARVTGEIVAWLQAGAHYGQHVGPPTAAMFDALCNALKRGDYKESQP